ncbi:MAG: hypothetical protein IPL52_00015 [Flavobacteriales bacterium]|nr:hypothetical protein [Flavobacteriales bacterium]
MAVVRETDEDGAPAWYVRPHQPEQRDAGERSGELAWYGELEGQARKTSEMRHHLERLGPKSWARIERIVEDVFPLSNQYWLSFYIGPELHDKKYIFLAGSIDEANFTLLPLMNVRGVTIEVMKGRKRTVDPPHA